jgi:hypothetical protein
MAYTNPRGLPLTDIGPTLVTLMACTLADYTSGGTQTPLVDDIVTFSATGNHYVKRAGDNRVSKLGRVKKIEVAPSGTAVGYVTVEWLDVVRFVEVACDDMSTMTLGNSAITDGADTVANNFDAGATTGNLIVIAKSSTASAAGTALCALIAA